MSFSGNNNKTTLTAPSRRDDAGDDDDVDDKTCVTCRTGSAAHMCNKCSQPVHNEVRECSQRPVPGDEESGPLVCKGCVVAAAARQEDSAARNDGQQNDDDEGKHDDDRDDDEVGDGVNLAAARLAQLDLRLTAEERREQFATILNNLLLRFGRDNREKVLGSWAFYDDCFGVSERVRSTSMIALMMQPLW